MFTEKIKRDKLKRLKKDLLLNAEALKRISIEFIVEMTSGLSGKKSSLKMLPAFTDGPTGKEKGTFISIDMGGTNFRIQHVVFDGKRKASIKKQTSAVLTSRQTEGSADDLFNFIALEIRKFFRSNKLSLKNNYDIGFTFSFPTDQTSINSGKLIAWTKGFKTKGVVGRNVAKLLENALVKKGMKNIRVAALVNDTIGVLAAASYRIKDCGIGLILGTGTNACYVENISELKIRSSNLDKMIINMEWGNFNRLPLTEYDKKLDAVSTNPGKQILEKAVSGKYIGEIVRLITVDMKEKGLLMAAAPIGPLEKSGIFKSEYASRIEADRTRGLIETNKILRGLGIGSTELKDRRNIKAICSMVSDRAARITAAALIGVIKKQDPDIRNKHVVAVDGSIFEKYVGFRAKLNRAVKICAGKKKSRNIKFVLSKDGSGIGAAVLAAHNQTGRA